MTEPRSTRRADGRGGWGGRGERPGARGSEQAADRPAAEPGRRSGEAQPPSARSPGGSDPSDPGSGRPSPGLDDDAFAGPAGSPWVRYERPAAGTGGEPRGLPPLPDLSAVLAVLEGLRAMVPPELSQQLNHLIRELLLTLRALIDWYLDRLDDGPRGPEVEDIPIE